MAVQVNVLEAKNRLSELIRKAAAGEEIVIANRGVAVVRLVPVPGTETAAGGASAKHLDASKDFGSAEAILEFMSRPRPAWMRRSAEEIDADIADMRAAWD